VVEIANLSENGTIVTVKKLFHSLPVRELDFIKNNKSQYQQLIILIKEYSIICSEVKI